MIIMATQKKSAGNGNKNQKENKKTGAPNLGSETKSALQDLFLDEIKDIYWAEKHLVKALPKMKEAATTEELQEAIETHLEQTKEQVMRLEQVFELLEEKPQAKKCDAMEGLVSESESV